MSDPIADRASPAPSTEPAPPWQLDRSKDEFTYEMLTQRFLVHDQMLWQTPALALTAQAFLMSIALAENAPLHQTLITCVLGIILMAMSIHLLARHRFLALIEKAKLSDLERTRLHIEPLSTHAWAWRYASPPRVGLPYTDQPMASNLPRYPRVLSISSYRIWVIGLGLFVLADILIAIAAIVSS